MIDSSKVLLTVVFDVDIGIVVNEIEIVASSWESWMVPLWFEYSVFTEN